MNIVILGPQGSGKGTQAKLLAEKFGLHYFSMGDLVRELAKKRPDIKVKIDAGTLLPNDEGFEYVKQHFEGKGVFDNIVFDGFPRTLGQYQLVSNWLKEKGFSLNLVIVLEISGEESVKRLSARRMDPKTGEIYNLLTNPPPPTVDVNTLVHREDDRPEAIRNRLGWYHSIVEPMIEAVQKEIPVYKIDGDRPIAVIHQDILHRLRLP